MDILTITVEAVVLLIFFTAAVLIGSRNPVDGVYDMPQPIIDRCIELGLVDETKKASSKETKLKKLGAALILVIILSLFLYFVNKARTFREGFLVSYILWLIIDWYDCFVLDWGWVCHSKKIIIPGTEDLMDSFHDYKFHFIGSCKGMLIGLPVCLVVGALMALVSLIF